MGVSRNTTEGAYEQLVAEGYLARRVGSGTFVASCLPGRPLGARPGLRPAAAAGSSRGLSERGRALARSLTCNDPLSVRAFGAGFPALDEFPADLWRRLTSRRLRLAGRRSSVTASRVSAAARGDRPLSFGIAQRALPARRRRRPDELPRYTSRGHGPRPGTRCRRESSFPGRTPPSNRQARATRHPGGRRGSPGRTGNDARDARLAYVTPSRNTRRA